MQCCPLQKADEVAKVYTRDDGRRARKEHVCCECSEQIRKGDMHCYVSMLFDGHWSSYRTCLRCTEIGDHFSCGGRVVGTLWDDLEENFFPDMRMGGPCMEGLSPAAKLMLVEYRMAWYLTQSKSDFDDSNWERWLQNPNHQEPIRTPIVHEEKVPYYETPEYYWKRELELDVYRDQIAREKEK